MSGSATGSPGPVPPVPKPEAKSKAVDSDVSKAVATTASEPAPKKVEVAGADPDTAKPPLSHHHGDRNHFIELQAFFAGIHAGDGAAEIIRK